jgi:hypothetical protein
MVSRGATCAATAPADRESSSIVYGILASQYEGC